MVRDIFVPALRKEKTNGMSSWSAGAIDGLLAAGILLDDEEIYNEAKEYYSSTDIPGSVASCSKETGQSKEMGRDNVHAMLTLDDLGKMARLAWIQGDDLFSVLDDRLLKVYDYWCRYNSGHEDTYYEPWGTFYYISTHNNGFRLRPDGTFFESIYHHYKEVKGLNENNYPYLALYTKLARPEQQYGTLFYNTSIETSPVFSVVPQKAEGVKAQAGLGCVYLSWNHPQAEDARGFKIYRSTDGKFFSLIKTWDYYTRNLYKDEDVKNGTTYYYKVVLINRAGDSEASDIVTATPQAGSNTLTEGWKVENINTTGGTGLYTDASNCTFAVNGTGVDVNGTKDSETFAYRKMTANGSLIVRLTSTRETFKRVGIMMRQHNDGDSKMVSLQLGDTGWRYCYNVLRSSDGANTSWTLGDDFTYAPCWFKIERIGNYFTTYQSRDGKNWHQVARNYCSMLKTINVGMFACTGTASGEPYQAVFDNVTFTDETYATPSAPTSIKAEALRSSEAKITWTKSNNTSWYNIERAEGTNTVFTTIAETYKDTVFTDTNLKPSTTYTYRVRPVNMAGISSDSAIVSVTTPQQQAPQAPKGISSTWAGKNLALIEWQQEGDATSYSIERSDADKNSFTEIGKAIANSFRDSSVIENSSYLYRVIAINEVGKSEPSETDSVTIYPIEKIKGTIIGTTGSYGDNTNNTRNAVFDGNLNTFFDAPSANGSWVGYDLGLLKKAEIVSVKFAPRSKFSSRMVNGQFQVANQSDFSDAQTIYVVDNTPIEDAMTEAMALSKNFFRYMRYIGPDGGSCNVAEIEFWGHTNQLKTQRITFPTIAAKYIGDDDFDPGATASSGLPVSYTSQNENVATIVDGKIHIVGIGTSRIVAKQEGNEEWAEASKSTMLTVNAATGITEIEGNDIQHFTVYDLQGRKMGEFPFSSINELKTNNQLAKSVYIVNGKKFLIK